MISPAGASTLDLFWKGKDTTALRALEEELDLFFRMHEKRAFRIAVSTLLEREDALDAVQESMTRLVRSYTDRPREEWPPLFYRILQNVVRDILRRRTRRRGLFFSFTAEVTGGEEDPLEAVADPSSIDPLEACARKEFAHRLHAALVRLPRRQREAFTLRILSEADVATAARSMGCSTGSVKTHLSRAIAALRRELGNDAAF
jgi:RNA polymerase sigma-70 factor (ECF subfamily)